MKKMMLSKLELQLPQDKLLERTMEENKEEDDIGREDQEEKVMDKTLFHTT